MAGIVRISEGSNLALHALAYLVHHQEGGLPIPVNRIARVLGASRDHLGKVMQRLSRQGFVNSRRGPRGGFTVGRSAEELTLLEIIEAVDGPLNSKKCLLGNPVCATASCLVSDLMERIYNEVHRELSSAKLSELVKAFEE